jgi:hypothetical protein
LPGTNWRRFRSHPNRLSILEDGDASGVKSHGGAHGGKGNVRWVNLGRIEPTDFGDIIQRFGVYCLADLGGEE